MILDGTIDLDVPVEKAWDFLIDINKFSTCLPGIDEIRQIDDKTFEGLISAAVGPISGKFNFRSTIIDSNPPEQMVVKTQGTDSVTKPGQCRHDGRPAQVIGNNRKWITKPMSRSKGGHSRTARATATLILQNLQAATKRASEQVWKEGDRAGGRHGKNFSSFVPSSVSLQWITRRS
jgi:hypothetical protein